MTSRTMRLPLAIALAASLLAFSRSLDSGVGLGLSIVALLTPLVALRLDPSLERLARLLARFAIAAAVLAGWALAIAPMLHGERTDDILRSIGFVLAGCALPLALAEIRADAAILLCVLGLFGVAGLHRMIEIRPFVGIAGVATALHAMIAVRGASTGPRRPPVRRALLSVVIASIIATSLALGLPPAQRRVERALLSGRVIELKGRSGLSSEDVRVGEISSLAQSDRLVLRVFGPRAQRLRAQLFLRFDARVWHAVHEPKPIEPKETPLPVGPRAQEMIARMEGGLRLMPGVAPDALLGDEVIATRIEPVDLDEGLLLTPGDALAVKTEDEVHVSSSRLLLRNDRRLPNPYVVLHRRRLGIADEREPDAASLALALSLPRKVDERVRALAEGLSHEGGALLPPERRVERTVRWLKENLRYTLNTPQYGRGDLLAEILFEHRAGYCEHFATALAMLLRLEGVPTRYVTGFKVDEGDREGEHYVVRDENAHAWVEAYLPGTGWIEADATPIVESSPAPSGRMRRLREWIADLVASVRYGRLVDTALKLRWPIAIGLSLIGLVYVARNEVRRRLAESRGKPKARPREKLPPELEAFLRDVDVAWKRAGHPRPRSSGLLEHAAHAEANGLDAQLAAAIRAAVDAIHRAAFAGEPTEKRELAALRARMRGASGPAPRR